MVRVIINNVVYLWNHVHIDLAGTWLLVRHASEKNLLQMLVRNSLETMWLDFRLFLAKPERGQQVKAVVGVSSTFSPEKQNKYHSEKVSSVPVLVEVIVVRINWPMISFSVAWPTARGDNVLVLTLTADPSVGANTSVRHFRLAQCNTLATVLTRISADTF